jgi:hypothetical protein
MSATTLLPPWVQYVKAFSLLFIAFVGAWIAFRQMQIAAMRLDHDLYDRRYAVFNATRKMLAEFVSHANVTTEDLRAFLLGTGDAVFLFDDRIAEYLQEMRRRASSVASINIALEALPVGEQRSKAVQVSMGHVQWLIEQLDGLSDKFKPYLRLSRRQRLPGRWWSRLLLPQ